jgi:hypothetical protein
MSFYSNFFTNSAFTFVLIRRKWILDFAFQINAHLYILIYAASVTQFPPLFFKADFLLNSSFCLTLCPFHFFTSCVSCYWGLIFFLGTYVQVSLAKCCKVRLIPNVCDTWVFFLCHGNPSINPKNNITFLIFKFVFFVVHGSFLSNSRLIVNSVPS